MRTREQQKELTIQRIKVFLAAEKLADAVQEYCSMDPSGADPGWIEWIEMVKALREYRETAP